MTTKELIRAEIERLKSKYRHNGLWTSSFQSDLAMAKIESMNELLSFIDTLPDEPISEYLEEAAVSYCFDNGLNLSPMVATDFARHFAEWGAEHLRDTTKMSPEDLKEAAVDTADGLLAKPKDYELSARADYWNGAHDGFIAGAEWMKAKMTEGAVEGEVCILPGYVAYVKEKNNESLKQYLLDNFKTGDEVRIIILQKED